MSKRYVVVTAEVLGHSLESSQLAALKGPASHGHYDRPSLPEGTLCPLQEATQNINMYEWCYVCWGQNRGFKRTWASWSTVSRFLIEKDEPLWAVFLANPEIKMRTWHVNVGNTTGNLRACTHRTISRTTVMNERHNRISYEGSLWTRILHIRSQQQKERLISYKHSFTANIRTLVSTVLCTSQAQGEFTTRDMIASF